MVDYYYLLNEKVPKDKWVNIAGLHHYAKPLQFDERQIIADVDDTADLRNFIGCILDLLEAGHKYEEDFTFSSAG